VKSEVEGEVLQLAEGGIPVIDNDVEAPSMEELGSRIGRLRADKGMTLSALASLADVSQGLLSQMERGRGNPSFATLVKLARALQTPVGTFFSGIDVDAPSGLVKANERRKLVMSATDIEYELLTPTLHGRLAVYMTRIPAGWSNEHLPSQHEGEEVAVVLEGELFLSVSGKRHHLVAGDAVTYDASEPHWSHNPTKRVTIGLKAVTPPSF
jgi:transcriptional regulator with XRE-family HTH domain